MKSAYQNLNFATFWNEISGSHGQAYKKYVLDPCLFKMLGNISGKSVLDLGCGNGYLGSRFIKLGCKKVILMDISSYNLENARQLNNSHKIEYLCQDATRSWKIDNAKLDIVFSDMFLNEIKNIKKPIFEAYRVLKRGGQFLVTVTHPAWDLFEFSYDQLGKSRKIIKGAGPYFFRGPTKFMMGTESLKPANNEKYPESFEIEHYQRPIEDYFNTLTDAGFVIKKIMEPELTSKILKHYPGYKDLSSHPISLIFNAIKK